MFLKNSAGNPSLTATLVVVSFIVVMFKVILNGVSGNISGFTFSFGSIDAPTVAVILTPILSTYVVRRYTDDVSVPNSQPVPNQSTGGTAAHDGAA